MDFTLPEEYEMLRESARKFAEDHIAPYAAEWDQVANYPDDLIKKLGDQGFMGILIPTEYGGSGGTHTMFAIVLEELARIQSHDIVLPTATQAQIHLRCVAHPDAAQAALLDRLGIVLPKRMRLPEHQVPALAASA